MTKLALGIYDIKYNTILKKTVSPTTPITKNIRILKHAYTSLDKEEGKVITIYTSQSESKINGTLEENIKCFFGNGKYVNKPFYGDNAHFENWMVLKPSAKEFANILYPGNDFKNNSPEFKSMLRANLHNLAYAISKCKNSNYNLKTVIEKKHTLYKLEKNEISILENLNNREEVLTEYINSNEGFDSFEITKIII